MSLRCYNFLCGKHCFQVFILNINFLRGTFIVFYLYTGQINRTICLLLFFWFYLWMEFYRPEQFHITTAQMHYSHSVTHTSPGCIHSNFFRMCSLYGYLTILTAPTQLHSINNTATHCRHWGSKPETQSYPVISKGCIMFFFKLFGLTKQQ